MPGPPALSLIASLRGALEAARGVRTPDDLRSALDGIATLIAESMSYRCVVVNLHRPAWDDFEVTTVHGPDAARAQLLGTVSTWDQWAPYLAPRYERRGAQHVRADVAPPDPPGMSVYKPDAPSSADPSCWDPDDLLIVLMRRSNGDVLGILSIDEPLDGRRPADDELDRVVALAEVASLAVEQALDAQQQAGHHVALERLLGVSSRISDQRSRGGVLDEVCSGIRGALGFQRVAVLLADERGALRPAATAGWQVDDPVLTGLGLTLGQVEPLMQPRFERDGCYLLEREEAEALLHLDAPVYESFSNGRGPYAWERHWLLVPLLGPDGARRGMIWADDPVDRLLPSRPKLQALRLFAGQSSAALENARDYEATAHLAHHDGLTGLANRATLSQRLEHALRRVRRSDSSVAVLFIDLDNFKQINDERGHHAGDALLRTVAARIDADLRPGDTVARFGGDEFVVLCEDVAGPEDAMEVAERLRGSLAREVPLSGGAIHVTASIGVALPDRPDRGAEELLEAADRAMYEAKAAGRDATRLAAPGAGWS
ncbi:MAG TPA: GGDEF domain-containing protein [Baekduia sp.]|nr:GGDEF domain-containing protein [Baekduia sp.]